MAANSRLWPPRGRSGNGGSVTRAGRGIRWCLQPRRSAVKRTRDKGHPRRRSSNAAGAAWPRGGREGRGRREGWDLGCEVEGAGRNLFQYLERESKELALRWTPGLSQRTALSALVALSHSFRLFLSVHRTFNESFIPLLYPFRLFIVKSF